MAAPRAVLAAAAALALAACTTAPPEHTCPAPYPCGHRRLVTRTEVRCEDCGALRGEVGIMRRTVPWKADQR